jgi:hypothetical protein
MVLRPIQTDSAAPTRPAHARRTSCQAIAGRCLRHAASLTGRCGKRELALAVSGLIVRCRDAQAADSGSAVAAGCAITGPRYGLGSVVEVAGSRCAIGVFHADRARLGRFAGVCRAI